MKRFFGFLFASSVTFFVAAFFCRFDVDFHHDGIFLKPAVDLLHGQRLFTDSFSIYGPLTSTIQFIAMKFFGEYLFVLKLLTALTYGLVGGVLFVLSSFIMPMWCVFFTFFLWIAMAPYYELGVTFYIWPSVFSLLFQLLSVLFLYYWINKKRVLFLIFAGICTAITYWFRQPVGILLYLSVFIFFYLQRYKISFKQTIPYHLSFFIIHVLALLIMIHYGVIKDWFFQSVIFVSWWHQAVSGHKIYPLFVLEKLFPLSYNAISLWVVLPAAAFFVLWKRNSKPMLLLLALVSVGSWAQYYPMSDMHHNYWAATPLFPLIVAVFYTQFKQKKKILLMMLLLCVLFFPDIYNRARMARKKIMKKYIKIQEPTILKDMLVEKSKYDEIQKIYSQIKKYEQNNPTGLIITNGQRVLPVTFAKNKKNCHPFTSNWGWEVYNHNFNVQYQEVIDTCKKNGALIIK